MTISSRYKNLLERFPFLTLVKYGTEEYVGIVANADGPVFNIYCWDLVKTDRAKIDFLRMGEEWWFESNRSVPINLLLIGRWNYTYAMRSLNSKNVQVLHGDVVSFGNLIQKRKKRKNIQLIKKVD